MPLISVENITKTYTMGDVEVRALRGVSLSIDAGEFVAVTGPSGSGKSTLMHILGCLDRPTKGRYTLEDRDISVLSKNQLARVRNNQIGFVFQGFNLLARTTALDNVELPLLYANAKHSSSDRRRQAEQMLVAVGLRDRMHHLPNQLSGGQQQRLCIARALAPEPEVLLMDEPASALDPISTLAIEQLINDLCKDVSIIIVTHNMQQAARVSHETAFFMVNNDRAGYLVEFDDTSKIFTNPNDERTEAYITGRFS